MKPSPTARERRLLALAKCWKAKAQEKDEVIKAMETQIKRTMGGMEAALLQMRIPNNAKIKIAE